MNFFEIQTILPELRLPSCERFGTARVSTNLVGRAYRNGAKVVQKSQFLQVQAVRHLCRWTMSNGDLIVPQQRLHGQRLSEIDYSSISSFNVFRLYLLTAEVDQGLDYRWRSQCGKPTGKSCFSHLV